MERPRLLRAGAQSASRRAGRGRPRRIAAFGGVKRRFTPTGEWNGATIFDDYGHHPVEIAAVLRAARTSSKAHVIAIVQPHRYTRLHSLFDGFTGAFDDADTVIVADVYSAAAIIRKL